MRTANKIYSYVLLLVDKEAKHRQGISIKDLPREGIIPSTHSTTVLHLLYIVCDNEAQQNQENVRPINYYFKKCKNIMVGDANKMTLKYQ